MASLDSYLASLRTQIEEVEVGDLAEDPSQYPSLIVDVREEGEFAQGHIPGATWIPRGLLEMRVEEVASDLGTPILLYCATGQRSLLAAKNLKDLGFELVRQRGSHREYRHEDGRGTTVPFHAANDIAPTLLRKIAKDIGLSVNEFLQSRS